jgi:aminoglycoside 3-N-acetyltransferase
MPHTRDTLAQDLRKMGFKKGDVLMVHSSLKSIGWVEGGADAVIDAILSVIGEKEGVLFVPTLTATFAAAGWSELCKYAWDPKETPSRVGAITDALWRRPNACRSDHPTHSLAAIGRNAQELVEGHGGNASTFDKNGPYGKYVRMGATILFIGTGMGCNTTLHVAEDWAELPYMDQNAGAKAKKDGQVVEVPLRMSPNGHRSFYAKDEASPAVKLFYGLGQVREEKLGDAKVQIIAAQDVINGMMKTYYNDDPAFLLCKKEECEFCRKGREACAKEHPRIRKTIETLMKDGWCRIW